MSNTTQNAQSTQKKQTAVIIILVILLAICLVVIATLLWKEKEEKDPGNSFPIEQVEKLTDSIDFPGYEELHFKSDRLQQNMTVPNPPQNFCWYKVSLVLEDNTVLWTSDMIAPGENSGPVVLKSTLNKGEYKNAKMIFQCFSDEKGQNALNGAEMKLTIIVK